MSKYSLILVLAAALLLTGCKKSSGITYMAPALEEDWSVKFILSGGFEGLMRNIEFRSDGSYTFTDERDGNTGKGKISQDELKTLEGLISALA